MDDDNVETREDCRQLWRSFLEDLLQLIHQAGLQKQQLARHVEVSPSTVGRWLRSTTPVGWERLGPVIDACIEHAHARGLTLAPAHFADRGHWKRALDETLSRQDEEQVPPREPENDPVPHQARLQRRPVLNLTLVASPVFALLVVVLLASVTTFSLSTAVSVRPTADTSVTSSPTPHNSSPAYDRDLRERSERPPPADRYAPRPTLSPAADDAPQGSATSATCDTSHLPDFINPLIITCTPVSVTLLLCPKDVAPTARPEAAIPTRCRILELESAGAR